jgi:hypothetical protein
MSFFNPEAIIGNICLGIGIEHAGANGYSGPDGSHYPKRLAEERHSDF